MGTVFLSSVCGLKPMLFKISGKDILPVKDSSAYAKLRSSDDVRVTLVFQGETTVWDLSINTRTRTLYCLVNRATKAQTEFDFPHLPNNCIECLRWTLWYSSLSQGT